MFSLSNVNKSNNLPDTLIYQTGNKQYRALIIPSKYFTYLGYLDYLCDNLKSIKFVNNRAVYEMVNLPMELVDEPTELKTIE
jgi:hypothetical protein